MTVKDSTNNVHVEDNKNILGGQQSDFVAAFELVAQDEDILLEDIIISETSNNADFTQAIKTLTVFDQDRTTILYGPKTVNSPSVYLNDALITVPQSGGKIIYVKLEADQIGQNRNGTQSGPFSLSLTVPAGEATGRSSGDDMTVAGGSTLAAVGSEPFSVVPVSISALSFEDESLK